MNFKYSIKKLRLFFVFALSLACLNIFTSCSVSTKSPTDLINRPKLSVDNKIAKDLIQRELPTGAKLIRPLKPGKLTSVGYFDWDNDNNDEAYAFYKLEKEQIIGIMILQEEDSTWKVVNKTELAGIDIAYADFIDLNSDGKKDLLFGAEKGENALGTVNLYISNNNNFINVWSAPFTNLVIDDIDNDKNKEILCVKHDRNSESKISAYEYIDGEIRLLDELKMDVYISGYYNVFSGYLEENKKALFLDFNLGSKSASNIIELKDKKLQPLFPLFNKDDAYKISEKSNDIKSKDINKDDLVEFASNYNLSFLSNQSSEKGIYAWNKYKADSKDKFEVVDISFIDKKAFYEFIFPEAWFTAINNQKISAVISSDKHKRNFVTYFYVCNDLDMYELLTFEYFENEEEYNEFKNSIKNKYYEYFDVFNTGKSRLIAYYNKSLTIKNQDSNREYISLKLTKDEIKGKTYRIK